MAQNPNQPPRPDQGNNQNPTSAEAETPATPFDDYVEGRRITPEQGQTDPAASVVSMVDYVQRSIYEVHPGINQENIFESNSAVPGAYEAMTVLKELRKDRRSTLLPSEKALLKHMNLVGDRYRAHARLDFEAIQAAHSDLSPVEAQNAAVQEMLTEVTAQRDASTDDSEKRILTMKIQMLKDFLDLQQNPVENDDKLYAKMLQADYRAQKATGDKKQKFDAEVTDLTKQVRAQDKPMIVTTGVYQLLGEKYGKAPLGNAAEMPVDPRLAYEAPETPEQKAARAADEAQRKAAEAAEAEMEAAELAGLREQVASGGLFSEMFKSEQQKALRDRYRELSHKQAKRKYADVLDNPHADKKTKAFIATKAVLEEQAALRAVKNEKIKNTPIAKICKWVGRHKIIVMGASVILAPVTGGMSLAAGVAIGGGIIAGAAVDEKYRGMQTADKAINVAEFLNKAEQRRRVSYGDMHDWGMKAYDRDRYKEYSKRIGAAALAGSIGLFGPYFLPSTAGADHFIWQNAATIKPWAVYGGGAAAYVGANKHKINSIL